MQNQKVGIIIQARVGSTRLKEKLKREFFNKKSLGQVVFENLNSLSREFKTIVATTKNIEDDYIEKIAKENSFTVFRGSENNVLSRFIKCAEASEIDVIVRVCSDNPFLQIDYIYELIRAHRQGDYDYTSFFLPDNTPVIKSHFGFFSEVVNLEALRRIRTLTNNEKYLEHVTNFIYENPESFKINRIPTPLIVDKNRSVRFTIDTVEDLELISEIYAKVFPDLRVENIVSMVDNNEEYRGIMKEQIKRNEK